MTIIVTFEKICTVTVQVLKVQQISFKLISITLELYHRLTDEAYRFSLTFDERIKITKYTFRLSTKHFIFVIRSKRLFETSYILEI